MKKLNKIASLALALVLALSLAAPSMAANTEDTTDGSIVISNAYAGETYHAYRLFEVSYSGDNYAYTITKDSEAWDVLMATGTYTADANGVYTLFGMTLTPSTKTSTDGVVYTVNGEGLQAANLATALRSLKDNENAAFAAWTAAATLTASETNKTLADLPVGYYFVDSSIGSLCVLDTNAKDVTIEDKNNNTDFDKTVKEAGDEEYTDHTDAQVGDTVNYLLTVTKQKGANQDYTVTDTLSEGLTLQTRTIVVKAGETTWTAGTEYTLTLADNGFTVVLKAAPMMALEDGTKVTIAYDAVINNAAVVEKEGNENDATLDYGEQHFTDVSKVYTYEFDLAKYTGETPVALEGAVFNLKDSEDNVLSFVKTEDTYKLAEEGTEGAVTNIEAGIVTISGLDADTYTLVEIEAPTGYNLLKDPITVAISSDLDTTAGTVNNVCVNENNNTVTIGETTYDVGVLNQSGAVMPSTGGIGTTIFYVVGGLLVVCAGVILVSKKRMGA